MEKNNNTKTKTVKNNNNPKNDYLLINLCFLHLRFLFTPALNIPKP